MQYKLQYQLELLFNITVNCNKVDATQMKNYFTFFSINDLPSIFILDDFQSGLVSPLLIEMLCISICSNFSAFTPALSLMMILCFHYMMTTLYFFIKKNRSKFLINFSFCEVLAILFFKWSVTPHQCEPVQWLIDRIQYLSTTSHGILSHWSPVRQEMQMQIEMWIVHITW